MRSTTPKLCKCGCGRTISGKSRTGFVKYHNRPDILTKVCPRGHDRTWRNDRWVCPRCKRARYQAQKYNITVDQALAHPSSCEACDEEAEVFVDHDHNTGQFRGWLCHGCNSALGRIQDSVLKLHMLIAYLERVS
jgi:hypothetical protein